MELNDEFFDALWGENHPTVFFLSPQDGNILVSNGYDWKMETQVSNRDFQHMCEVKILKDPDSEYGFKLVGPKGKTASLRFIGKR